MASKAGKIRVGIIRCDTHGFWYAHLFDKPDPARMRRQHRGCHYYFFKRDDPSQLRLNPVSGMTIARVFDEEDPANAERLSNVFGGRAKICRSVEEVSNDVDLVYIADCNYEGKDHLRYATPGLRKGVPHFVDKPFAHTLRDARKIIALAEKHHTAVMCASLLRYSPHLERFGKRLADVAPVARVDIPSLGPSLAGVFHAINVAQNIMGYGCEWVESMGEWPLGVVLMRYAKPQSGRKMFALVVNSHMSGPRHAFHASASSNLKPIYLDDLEAFVHSEGGLAVMNAIKKMIRTGRPALPYGEMIEPVAVAEAGRKAHNKTKAVALKGRR